MYICLWEIFVVLFTFFLDMLCFKVEVFLVVFRE